MIDRTSQAAGIADMLAQIRSFQDQVQSQVAPPSMPISLSPTPGMTQLFQNAMAAQGLAPPAASPSVSVDTLPNAPPIDPNDQSGTVITPPSVRKASFGEVVRDSLASVNDLQMQSSAQRAAYEKGENIPLTDVVLGMQKSSLAFEATLQIRNKVLKAYEDVLNMPV